MADSPTTVPSARTSPTVPGSGASGSSSRAPKTVVVESNPGNDATRTATINSCAHSFVESGHRPEMTNPFSAPWEWKGETSTARPDPVSISPSATPNCTRHAGGSMSPACARQRLPASGHEQPTSQSQKGRRALRATPQRSRAAAISRLSVPWPSTLRPRSVTAHRPS